MFYEEKVYVLFSGVPSLFYYSIIYCIYYLFVIKYFYFFSQKYGGLKLGV